VRKQAEKVGSDMSATNLVAAKCGIFIFDNVVDQLPSLSSNGCEVAASRL
jgi:hypothetical protein